MTAFTIERLVSEDGMTRKAWEFEFGTRGLRLLEYREQTRKTIRHKWKGPIWTWMDERDYQSKLPRPVSIPADVVEEARDEAEKILRQMPIFIGWFSTDHIMKSHDAD